MNTPKPKTQQAIDAVKARLARGEITAEQAQREIAGIRARHYEAVYRELLDQMQNGQREDSEPGTHEFESDAPMVRPFVEAGRVSGRARVYEAAHMILIGQMHTVGMLVAELHQRFTLADVSEPEPHPRGVRVDADITPHHYLARPQGGPQ